MIQFLRKVRQKLIRPGKTKSYLLYAIGEIILVVIGILIALQINNWNEEYKELQLEKSYYCRLLEDVNLDLQLLEKLMRENKSRITSGVEMLALLQKEKANRKEVITKMRGAVNRITFGFKPTTAAFEDIKSSGHLNIIHDVEIKKQLLNYYSVINGYVAVIDLNTGTALAVYTNPNKDFFDVGFQDIASVAKVLDTAAIDVTQLQNTNYPSAAVRKLLISEAVFYLNINTRKDELCRDIKIEILAMKNVLEKKCAINKCCVQVISATFSFCKNTAFGV